MDAFNHAKTRLVAWHSSNTFHPVAGIVSHSLSLTTAMRHWPALHLIIRHSSSQ